MASNGNSSRCSVFARLAMKHYPAVSLVWSSVNYPVKCVKYATRAQPGQARLPAISMSIQIRECLGRPGRN